LVSKEIDAYDEVDSFDEDLTNEGYAELGDMEMEPMASYQKWYYKPTTKQFKRKARTCKRRLRTCKKHTANRKRYYKKVKKHMIRVQLKFAEGDVEWSKRLRLCNNRRKVGAAEKTRILKNMLYNKATLTYRPK